MTHPTTEQSIRERLARRLAAESSVSYERAPKYWLSLVDTTLAELAKPSEGMVMVHDRKDWEEWSVYELWQAMIQHIRDGGK